MGFRKNRYKRHFEKADYGKVRNAIYDTVNKIFGFMPSTVFEQTIEMKIGGVNIGMNSEESVYISKVCEEVVARVKNGGGKYA